MSSAPTKHSKPEDFFGLFSGSLLIATGIVMLKDAHILTGGLAGLALMITKFTSGHTGFIYFVISIPFLLMALFQRGWKFTLRSTLNLLAVSFLVEIAHRFIIFQALNTLAVAMLANILLGTGMLVIFRHNSSLGGFNIVALYFQDILKIQAGLVQFILDLLVLTIGLLQYSSKLILISLIGDLFLNLVLFMNHRNDRYLGRSQ